MAEGSRPDLSFHQVGRIHVLFALLNTRHRLTSCRLRRRKTAERFRLRRAAGRGDGDKTKRTRELVWRPNGPGGESGVVPPVPMPNTAVKRSSADDTRVTKPWENRPVPGPFGRRLTGAQLAARA